MVSKTATYKSSEKQSRCWTLICNGFHFDGMKLRFVLWQLITAIIDVSAYRVGVYGSGFRVCDSLLSWDR